MRINQSPHWRALAVLGALLTVIIVWPTVLSMPILTTRTPTTINNNIQDHQHPILFSNTTSSAAIVNNKVAPNEIANQIVLDNRTQITNFSEYSDYDGSYLLHLNINTSLSDSSEDQVQLNDDHIDDDYEDQNQFFDEHLEHIRRGDIDPLLAIMTDGNVSNSRRVKKSNMINNKRKRKKESIVSQIKYDNDDDKLSAIEDVSNTTTYLTSASISDNDSSTVSLNLSENNINSVSGVSSSDEVVTATSSSIDSHQSDQSKRTRNLNKSDYDDVVSTTTTTTQATWTDDISNLDQQSPTTIKSVDNNNDTYVTTPIIAIEESRTKTLTHTELPVLSRTDRSVHTKRGISLRHRGNASRNQNKTTNAASAEAEAGDVSIKPRRLNNHNKIHNNFRNNNINNNNHTTNSNSSNLDRNERSTISHISGPGRKIQLYIKNRFIQLMTDGTVNGTQDDLSDYTILQRTTVDVGRIKIQGVATCLYLCMDQCGAVYGSFFCCRKNSPTTASSTNPWNSTTTTHTHPHIIPIHVASIIWHLIDMVNRVNYKFHPAVR